jgi:lipopolysaccharide/colanic/teichoic acid biosynthesis glycosyltransferase
MKRLFDVVVSALGLLLLSPVLWTLAILVRATSSGPGIYRSRRLGLGGRPFDMVKLRTMYVGTPDLRNADGSTFNAAHDSRVTPIGAWLRRTSLDELPQLWNVLMGEMSLVGPRPDLVDQLTYYGDADHRKLDVRPGITGLAQVSGRNSLTWKERRAIDLQYMNSRSFLMDLRILGRTIPGLLKSRDVFVTPRTDRDDEASGR